jgi:hypothetical protein
LGWISFYAKWIGLFRQVHHILWISSVYPVYLHTPSYDYGRGGGTTKTTLVIILLEAYEFELTF